MNDADFRQGMTDKVLKEALLKFNRMAATFRSYGTCGYDDAAAQLEDEARLVIVEMQRRGMAVPQG